MQKIQLKLTTPVIEMPIEAVDVAGQKDRFIAGFRRTPLDETAALLEKADLLAKEAKEEELHKLLKSQILYLKNATILYEENGKDKVLTIADTRKETVVQDEEITLDFLLELFLSWPSYTTALIRAFYEVNLNTKLGQQAEIKNF